ncbi:hypothetical protein EDB86DRAFT_2271635 [Lactarius hatsudake]|nr:hypothetical protein EDB86DRAFT_2271635 [Lactarius hatsudake]
MLVHASSLVLRLRIPFFVVTMSCAAYPHTLSFRPASQSSPRFRVSLAMPLFPSLITLYLPYSLAIAISSSEFRLGMYLNPLKVQEYDNSRSPLPPSKALTACLSRESGPAGVRRIVRKSSLASFRSLSGQLPWPLALPFLPLTPTECPPPYNVKLGLL